MTGPVRLFIPGTPAPKGSTKSFSPVGSTTVHTTNANENTKPWQSKVSAFVAATCGLGITHPRPEPVRLHCLFVMPRTASEPKRSTRPHTRKPDLDKLLRCVMDALTGLVYTDDTQVTSVGLLDKRTAEVGEQPGLHLRWESARLKLEIQAAADHTMPIPAPQKPRHATNGPSGSHDTHPPTKNPPA